MIVRSSRLFGTIAGLVTISLPAVAQTSNWYVTGSAGALFVGDQSRNTTIYNGLGQTAAGTNTTTYSPGEAFGVSLGYRLPLGFRAEAEFSYLHYTADTIDPFTASPLFPGLTGATLNNPSGGDHDRYTFTADLFYDLPFRPLGITPYVGGGVGYYRATATDAVFRLPSGPAFTGRGTSGGNAVILAEVGAAVPLTPKLDLVPAYRYEYYFGSNTAHNANIVKIGLRYSF